MKIDLKILGREMASVEVPDNLIFPDRVDLSVVPLICGMVVGMILPFGLMVFMKELLSIEMDMSVNGLTCVVSPVCAVCIVACTALTVLIAWLIYVLWKRWAMDNFRRYQKQSLEFVAGTQENLLKRFAIIITDGRSEPLKSSGEAAPCKQKVIRNGVFGYPVVFAQSADLSSVFEGGLE